MNPLRQSTLVLLIWLIRAAPSVAKFDPYQLNGGLVTAVAGRDYVLIASDTRLTNGGYGIISRRYLNGRIWSASSFVSLQSLHVSLPSVASEPSWDMQPAQWEADGSLAMPQKEVNRSATNSPDRNTHDEDILSSSFTNFDCTAPKQSIFPLPVLIGSAGCASDCESLKRRVRLELDALQSNFPSASTLGVQSVANLLQQILYGRRGFPFYSFCVVAGIDDRDCDGTGAVYVYDAIGSYERVAVGCSGTGREILQPILDRLFSESSTGVKDNRIECKVSGNNNDDVMSVPALEQRLGVAGSLRPPVRTIVNCTWEEAVTNIAHGFQAVAEREISIGDELVICLLRSRGSESDEPSVDVINFKLKKH